MRLSLTGRHLYSPRRTASSTQHMCQSARYSELECDTNTSILEREHTCREAHEMHLNTLLARRLRNRSNQRRQVMRAARTQFVRASREWIPFNQLIEYPHNGGRRIYSVRLNLHNTLELNTITPHDQYLHVMAMSLESHLDRHLWSRMGRQSRSLKSPAHCVLCSVTKETSCSIV